MPGRVDGTNTMFFIKKTDVPPDRQRDVTKGRTVCDYHKDKAKLNRMGLAMGGDHINYPDDCGTPTADLLTIKILLNSVISTPNTKFMTITPLKPYKYLQLKMEDIPEDAKQEYKLSEKVTPDGWVYVEVQKGMYGLLQTGLCIQELLATRLDTHGYT